MSGFRIVRPSSPLPDAKDFGGCLDGLHAWRQFGGLSLEEAYSKFVDCPEVHQEEFMWMRHPAFEYYFPVIDRYLREVTNTDDYDDAQAAILGRVMMAYLNDKEFPHSVEMLESISDLSSFVQSSLDSFTSDPDDQVHITKTWAKVDKKLSSMH